MGSVGQRALLVVHHSYAYGDLGAPTRLPVPPYADLVFDVKLIEINPANEEDLLAAWTAELVEDFQKEDIDAGQLQLAESTCSARVGTEGLLAAAGKLSFKAWLVSMDASGGLLQYEALLAGS